MPRFGSRSRENLDTCDERIQRVMERAIKDGPDFSVIVGHRTKGEQNRAWAAGFSKKKWPESNHNTKPSRAVDVIPYGGKNVWSDHIRFGLLAGWIMACAEAEGVNLRWGGDWSRTWRANERSSFFDGAHFELWED